MFTIFFQNEGTTTSISQLSHTGFRSRSRPEPEYLAGAGAVTLARLRLQLKFFVWHITSFDIFSRIKNKLATIYTIVTGTSYFSLLDIH